MRCLLPLMLAVVLGQSAWAKGEDALLEAVRSGQVGSRADQSQQLRRFDAASEDERRELLRAARERRDALQAESRSLEETARRND